MLTISDERLKHSIEVARLMKKMSEDAGWSQEKCEEMFVLGYLHDIGYEFSEQQCDHASVGGRMLKIQEYKYWQEVFFHGKLNIEYMSEELTILNIADMNIDSKGHNVGIKERLKDIAVRYGEKSKQFVEAKLLIEKIQSDVRNERMLAYVKR